jgi:hypothetical protein
VYTTRSESWIFKIGFSNELLKNSRSCRAHATRGGEASLGAVDSKNEHWQIAKVFIDTLCP